MPSFSRVGMVNSQLLTDAICAHIEPMAEVRLYPGEFEMEALAEGVLRVLRKSRLHWNTDQD